MIFFVVGAISSEFTPFFDDKLRCILQLVTGIFTNMGFTAFVYFFVQRPIKEALEAPLLRGSITMRHDHYLDGIDPNEPQAAPQEKNMQKSNHEKEEAVSV